MGGADDDVHVVEGGDAGEGDADGYRRKLWLLLLWRRRQQLACRSDDDGDGDDDNHSAGEQR